MCKNRGGRYTCLCGASLTEAVNKAAAELSARLKGEKIVDAKIAKTIEVVCGCGKKFRATKQPRRGLWKLRFVS